MGLLWINIAPCVTKWLHSSLCYFKYYIFKGNKSTRRRLLAVELEKCTSLVSCDFPHLYVLTLKLFLGICAVLPAPGQSLGVSPDTMNPQAFTSTFSVSHSVLCNRTSKSDAVNCFLACFHSLECGQVFEYSWGFQQAGWLRHRHCFPEGQLLMCWKHVSGFPILVQAAVSDEGSEKHVFVLNRWWWLPIIPC